LETELRTSQASAGASIFIDGRRSAHSSPSAAGWVTTAAGRAAGLVRAQCHDDHHQRSLRPRYHRVAAALLGAFTLAAVVASCGSSSDSGRHNTAANRIERPAFDRLLNASVGAPGDPPGVVALVQIPDGTWRGAVGTADLQSGRAIDVGDRFRAGSVTKTLTATVLLQLVAEHQLALEDTVAKRYPGVFAHGNQITLRQLLNHTSGIRNTRAEEFPPFGKVIPLIRDSRLRAHAAELARRIARGENAVATPQIWIAAAATQPLLFRPGTRFRYSNINYALLGEIIERRTGHTLAQEMQQRIFDPLHLDHTQLATTPTIQGSHTHGYSIGGPSPIDVTTAADLRGLLGSGFGAIVSTVDDLAHFYNALLNGRLLPTKLLNEMLAPVPTPLHWTDIPASGYGFGQIRLELPCGRAWGHGGGLDGYLTQVITDRNGSHIVVVAVNATGAKAGEVKTRLPVALYCRALSPPR
jgi:D-alanyl-D-alanine carboxypeptidase